MIIIVAVFFLVIIYYISSEFWMLDDDDACVLSMPTQKQYYNRVYQYGRQFSLLNLMYRCFFHIRAPFIHL